MKGKKNIILFFGILFTFVTIIGCSSNTNEKNESENTNEKNESESILEIAYPTQPETIDPQVTTSEAAEDLALQIYEKLVTINENSEVIPELAESYEESDDGKTITFKLREGVKFHDGSEMTAEDVIASMEKIGEVKPLLEDYKWEENDEYNITLHLEESSLLTMFNLASADKSAAIMPKSVAEDTGSLGANEYIGTGPFKFIEWEQDQIVYLEKFEDYQSVDEPASGLGGKKEALVDKIHWNFVSDASTRVNGLLSGEYDFAHMLSYDSISQIESDPEVEIDIWSYGDEILVFNKKEGLFNDVKARKAVNYGMDMEEIMHSAFTDEKYFDMDNAIFSPDQTNWYTDAGKEYYNQKDTDKAEELLDEIGYDDEEVVILTSKEYEHHYNASVATQQELERIGIKAKLDVYDWSTLLDRRDNPDQWDIFYTGFPHQLIPQQFTFLDSANEWPGWTDSEEIDTLLEEIAVQDSQEGAKEKYVELQQLTWEYLPVINLGKNSRVSAYSKDLEGYTGSEVAPTFWNVTIK